MIGAFVDAGLSKFVVRPAALTDGGLERFVGEFAAEMMPLQT
jgi:hypothetical protein